MIKYIHTEKSRYLTSDSDETAIPIRFVATDELIDLLSDLPAHQSRWVADNHFKAEKDEILKLSDHNGGISSVLIGLGSATIGADMSGIAGAAYSLPDGHYYLDADLEASAIKLLSIGWAIAQYDFDRYKIKKNRHNAVLVLNNETLTEEISPIINGIYLVRDLINTPTSDMGPSQLSDVVADLADQYGANFTSIVDDELLQNNLNTIHAVGRAATNKPRLLEMSWGREDAPKVSLVGKGVCFDTGGLDIKSAAGMRIMKKDMGGAAHTLGLAQMIMASGLDVHLRILIPAVENNISGDAFRPGDIIKTYKGTSVEVENTDAEGRLVLCDALALATEESPDLLIDFATLTGAARVALGTDVVPFFTDNDELAQSLAYHSDNEKDPIWRLPLHDGYKAQLKSNVADLRNMGTGPFGGAITAALFLKHFIDEPDNWVHFDMYAWNMSDKAICPKGGEAMAIRAVFAYLNERFK